MGQVKTKAQRGGHTSVALNGKKGRVHGKVIPAPIAWQETSSFLKR